MSVGAKKSSECYTRSMGTLEKAPFGLSWTFPEQHGQYIHKVVGSVLNVTTHHQATVTKHRTTRASHGLHAQIVTDNATTFTSEQFQQVCQA